MLTHSQIWAAIDALAAREGLTASSLARRSGLDPTTFNRSKRQNSEGQLRWPSTESIAKVLAATGAGVDEFIQLVMQKEPTIRRVPVRALEGRVEGWFDKNGHVNHEGWDEIAFPSPSDRGLFAIEVRGDRFAPIYRNGDVLIVAPGAEPRRGDRVFVLDTAGNASLEVLGHQSATHVYFTGLMSEAVPPRAHDTIRMIRRIVWASQ